MIEAIFFRAKLFALVMALVGVLTLTAACQGQQGTAGQQGPAGVAGVPR